MKSIYICAIIGMSLFFIVTSVKREDCSSYTCSTDKPESDTGVCMKQTKNSGGVGFKFEINHCKDGYTCNLADAGALASLATGNTGNFNCFEVPDFLDNVTDALKDLFGDADDLIPGTRVDGQDCNDSDKKCILGITCDGKCVGKDDGSSCLSHTECKTGSACLSLKCAKQKKSDESCLTEYDCENGYNCEGLKCKKYNSLDDGVSARDARSCSSGFTNGDLIAPKCASAPQKEDENCSDNADVCSFKYSDGTVYNHGCKCKEYTDNLDRECISPKANKVSPRTTVHTTLRFGEQSDVKDAVEEAAENAYGGNECLKNFYMSSSALVKVSLTILSVLALIM